MRIEPAHVNQVMDAGAGRYVEISADVGEVAADLARIDPALKVRFQPHCADPFFAVYCQPSERETYLVLTVTARQGATGVWLGLDQRVVREIERITADDYDYVGELDRNNAAARAAARQRSLQHLEMKGEEGFRYLRKLIGRNCRHMSVSALPPEM